MAAKPSLIELLTRYHANPLKDPAENRLTAALAAALEFDSSGTLAADLGERWLRINSSDLDSVTITIQRRISIGPDERFIDLEMDFGGDRVVWVEVKLHSREGEGQLETYRETLARRTRGRGRLILLAPAERRGEFRKVKPLNAEAHEPAFDAWQAVYGVLRDWMRRRGCERSSWLVYEVLKHLEKERLMEQALTNKHVDVLRKADEARGALGSVINDVAERLGERWGSLSGDQPRTAGRRLYSEFRYEQRTAKWVDSRSRKGHASFAWGVDLDVSASLFFAGVVFARDGSLSADREWRSTLPDPDWDKWEDTGRDEEWLYAFLPTESVTKKPRFDEQVEEVKRFVAGSFAKLEASRS